jgi:MFS transporter, ACDE family, multidrug resistance protein
MSGHQRAAASPFHQPKGVWAVALACVVSFMGIGLVDPILPALSTQLRASPSQVELLFTSYLVVTAVAMLVTGWVSSRIGGKRTLVAGLVLIVVFSALAGAANTIGGIIGFRAGWGLGNALFIATSLAVIIGAASGGFSGAIILYETALGVGIALGPLVGGELGGISWRLPFFGVTALMSIALVATLLFVEPTPRPARRTSIVDPLKALRHRGLATMSLTALGYNWGFFTLLAFTPFVMHLPIHQLGYVFTGWGIMVAIFAVFVAPRAQARFGTPRTLYVTLALLAVDLVVIGAFTSSQPTLIVAVIVSGAFVGLNNTLTTQAVMLVAPVEKPVASAAYGFVRFIGGGLAPYVASRLAVDINVQVPFYLGAATVTAAIVVLATGHSLLSRAEQGSDAELSLSGPATTPTGRESQPAPCRLVTVAGHDGTDRRPPIVAAVDASTGAAAVIAAAIEFAQLLDRPLEVLHVLETDVIEELALDLETLDTARHVIADNVERIRAAGVAGAGHLLRVVSGHGSTGRRIADFANAHHATMVVIGAPGDSEIAEIYDASLTSELVGHARCAVHIVAPASEHQASRVTQSVT